jgi:hypothetical protein
MLAGRRFALTKSIMALDGVDRRSWVTIPAGAIIRVTSGPNGTEDQLADVLWEGRSLTLFAVELTANSVEIKGTSA